MNQSLRAIIAPLAALLLLAAPAYAQPQSPAELRRQIEELQGENQRLATRLAEQQQQLLKTEARATAAEQRAASLESELARLREALARGGGNPDEPSTGSNPLADDHAKPPPQAAPTAPVPEDPMASPASLLAELQRRFEADRPGGSVAGDQPPARLTVAARRALEQWCAAQRSELRGSVSWRVRLTDLRDYQRGEKSAVMAVIDPASGLVIGEPLEVIVPYAYHDRIAREIARAGGDDKAPLWTLTATLTAAPHVNPDRPTPGVFNHPSFIGPYVEFAFDLKWEDVDLATPTAGVREPAPSP